MKTILVPTDFSENANKALEYAIHLAKEINAKVVVLNSYQIPSGSSNVMINFADILEQDSKEELEKCVGKYEKLFPGVEFIKYSCYGYINEAIEIVAKHYEVDLIVMGTAGASNIKSRVFGSNTVNTLKKIDFPIIVVPKDVEFKPWDKIILASNTDVNIVKAVDFMNKLTEIKELDIISVVEPNQKNPKDRQALKMALGDTNFKLHTEENSDVVEGISTFVNDHNSDIIILIRKTYSFIERIMHTSVTKQLALHTKKPLLLFKVK